MTFWQGRWKYLQVGGAKICDIIPTSGGLRPSKVHDMYCMIYVAITRKGSGGGSEICDIIPTSGGLRPSKVPEICDI